MSNSKSIRCFDYVNHPYQEVRDILSDQAADVFRNATRTAASRAATIASELHVNIAGFEVGTDISVSINKIDERPRQPNIPPATHLQLEWEAAKMSQLFPGNGNVIIFLTTAQGSL